MRAATKEFALGLGIVALAVGVITMDRETTPYAYLYDRTAADTEQQRFLNAVIQHAGVTREELQPLIPRMRAVWRDLPVIVLVARETGRPPVAIADLRRSGLAWLEICRKLNVPLKTFFAGVKGTVPDPYRAAWIEWRAKYRPELSDQQIRDMAALQLAHRITGEPVMDIAGRIRRGKTPQAIIAAHTAPRDPPKADTASARAPAPLKAGSSAR